ncbi:MAG: YbaN family protein [Planctomycetaceae bacterium]|nr:YbaN family protein [Planctomycetaceae bacterium]
MDALALTAVGSVESPASSKLRRAVFASAGVTFVGIGAIGVFVPGLPTVIWLMAASYFFARSNPQLEAKLIRNRFFGPYLIYLDRPATMPRRAKVSATLLMWGSVGLSLAMMAARESLTAWFATAVVFAAAFGTWFVWSFGRRRLGLR